MNWKEIDRALSELPLEGAQIQKIVQPSYDTLVLHTWTRSGAIALLLCVAHGSCRIHSVSRSVPKSDKPIRFCELLRSRVANGRIVSVRQLGAERIVRFDIRTSTDDYVLYVRLWSGAANILLTAPDGTVIDALARKPSRGEVSGGRYRPEDSLPAALPGKEFAVREFDDEPGTTYNEKLESFYERSGGTASRDKLIERVRSRISERRSALEIRLAELEKAAAAYADPERFREIGDLLMGMVGVRAEGPFVETEDFFRGGTARVEIDPKLDMARNAALYYEKHRKAKSGSVEVASEIEAARARLAELDAELDRLEAEADPFMLSRFLARAKPTQEKSEKEYGGIQLERDGWRILVGRSAKENDELLRKRVRGNDLWMHARDYAGSYVFLKARPGKTFPLDILLDAATLALYYSKGRSAGKGDLYYTAVKYLRRAKDGPLGLVIPTQEKNLHVEIDEARLRSLKSLIGRDD